jgi:hypothetical protein
MQRIILVGFKGCGKNTVGEYLVDQYGYVGMSFADALKDAVASIFCWDRQMLEGNTPEAREWREEIDPWWATKLDIPHFTPRWMLQNFGTDVMRNHFNPDIWISNVERRILNLGPDAKVVVFDGRFPNEIDLIKGMGGLAARVRRGPEPSWFLTAEVANVGIAPLQTEANQILKDLGIHPSESAWIGQRFDHEFVNDSTIHDLRSQVDLMIGQFRVAA